MKRSLYPHDWDAIARLVKEANDYICQSCGVQCRKPGEPWDGHKRTLTVAHWDHCYDESEVFVVPLCVTCHFLHDCRYSWVSRRRWERYRRRMAGQLEMFAPANGLQIPFITHAR